MSAPLSRLADAEREARTARVRMAHAMERAERLERERDRLLDALEPFARANVKASEWGDNVGGYDVLLVVYEEGARAAAKFFETARKVVEEIKNAR